MLTVTQDIPRLLCAGNAAKLELTRYNILSTPGQYGELIIQKSSLPSDGQTLILDLYQTFTFTFKNAPNGKFDIQRESIFVSQAATIANALNSIKEISDYYTAYVESYSNNSTYYVRLRAKSKNSLYSPTLSGGTSSFTQTSAVAGITPVGLSNYKVHLQVYVEELFNSAIYTKVYEASSSGDIDYDNNLMRISFFDVPKVLQSFMGFDLPHKIAAIHNCTETWRRFYYVFYESYGEPIVTQPYQKSDYRAAINIKLPDVLTPPFEYIKEQFSSSFYDDHYHKKPLTNWHKTMMVDMDWQGWMPMLYFVDFGDDDSLFSQALIQVYAKVYYDDGTSDVIDSINHSFTFQDIRCNLSLYPVGYKQLDIGSVAGTKRVLYWTVKLRQVGGFGIFFDITDEYKFVIDARNSKLNSYYLYNNMYGVPETLWCRGIDDGNRQETNVIYEAVVTDDSFAEIGNIRVGYRKGSDSVIKNTGYVSKDYALHLKEFMDAKHIYKIDLSSDDPQRYECMIQVSDKFKLSASDDFLHSISFELRKAADDLAERIESNIFHTLHKKSVIDVYANPGGSSQIQIKLTGRWGTMRVKNDFKQALTVLNELIELPTSQHTKIHLEHWNAIRLELGATSGILSLKNLNLSMPDLLELRINDFLYILDISELLRNLIKWQKVNLKDNNLSAALVNRYLECLLASRNTLSSEIIIDGNNAAPSGFGLLCKTELQGLGITVNTN